jgi:protein-S-isoprenylcysteine O-methyltransferase Ste14
MRPNESYIIATVTDAPPDPFFVRLGGWFFARRTWIPYPIIAALLLIPPQAVPARWMWAGASVVLAGEAIRLWAVRHIGVISRTRSDRLGPLVDSGPFAWLRNPLYVGNVLIWIGFSLVARLVWLAPIVAALLLFEYHAIVSWEERLLATRIGATYVDYMRRVSRWMPKPPARRASPGALFSWNETLFSERGTLIAIVLGFGLLWVKSRY